MDPSHQPHVSGSGAAPAWSKLIDVLEGMTEASYTLDEAWRITYLNASAEAYLKRERAGLVGTEYEMRLRRAFEQAMPCAFEYYDAARGRWKAQSVFPSPHGVAVSFAAISEQF